MLRGKSYESDKAAGMFGFKKVKRYRSAFTTSQINYLEKQFEKCPYIGSATRKEVANILNIPERAIKIWFQNRRMKEKKEVNSKEYNIDRHDMTNDMELVKDSLNNVNSSQSANDDQRSLQATIEKRVDTSNCRNYYHDATYSHRNRIDTLKKETIDNHKLYTFKNDMANSLKQDVETFNTNNIHNNNSFINYLEPNKKSETKNKTMPKTTLEASSVRNSTLEPSTLSRYQDLPEDLSARNLSNALIQEYHRGNIHLSSGYTPICNTQDVCLSAGNVIWKPVNVMPGVSTTIPVTIPERQPNISPNHSNVQKCKCICNCYSGNKLNYNQSTIGPQPQYVIAIPYNNSLSILR